MEFIDTHTHLNDEQFEEILTCVLDRASQAKVVKMLVVGTTLKDSRRAVELAESFEPLYAVVGIQPNYVDAAEPNDFAQIRELAQLPSVVAVGETGLDRYWDYTPFEKQEIEFHRHIELSIEVKKPFVVHMRDCGDDIVNSLERYQGQKLHGVMHSFTGTLSQAEKCMEAGLQISFAGMLTFKKSDELRSVARQIPLDRLLIETDCPYLAPHPHRGQRPNEPSLVVHTAQCLADLHQVSLEELADATSRNARELFQLP